MAKHKEVCAGCGAKADEHPYIGVMHKSKDADYPQAKLFTDLGSSQHSAHAVCEECWRDPEHRTTEKHRLPMHFYTREGAVLAMEKAGTYGQTQ